ncbi:unnamed protein product [Euphydryas editha]|uniref:Uncharacterized protein n=1 Tax=Euphydryas editha TaxID=104508 RepID=A0AAU9VAV2_EUPED|nr:unnamed protein product [Euphydryas editha]
MKEYCVAIMMEPYHDLTKEQAEAIEKYMYQLCCKDKTNLSEIQLDDTSRFIRLRCIYLGVVVMDGLNNPDVMARPDLITSFRSKYGDDLLNLCKRFKDRFPFDNKF